jgi:hypothetical protein
VCEQDEWRRTVALCLCTHAHPHALPQHAALGRGVCAGRG